MKTQWLVDTFIIFSVAVLLGTVVQRYQPYGLVWNATPSIPVGLYLTKEFSPSEPLVRGEVVCWKHKDMGKLLDRGYLPAEMRICKPVAGLPGDAVSLVGDTVTVTPSGTGHPVSAVVGVTDSKGRSLPRALEGVSLVPDDSIVVLAPEVPKALDSRNLGPIPLSILKNRMTALWYW